MTNAEQCRRIRENRRSQGCCTRCGEPKDGPCRNCADPGRDRNYRLSWERLGLCTACGGPRPCQPYFFKCCVACRQRATDRYRAKRKRNGPQARSQWPTEHGRATGESRKWAELDSTMQTECQDCGLRGEHECLVGIDYTARTGPGRIYPEGGI